MPPDSAHPQRASMTSRIAGYNTLIIVTCLLALAWLVHTQLQWSVHQQADALGDSLLQQTRTAAGGALSADDTLSVAVLLRELVNNPYVTYAALHGADSRILAEVGKRPKLTTTESGFYSKKLFYQNSTAGSLHLQIDLHKLQEPLIFSMQSIGALGLALLLFAVFLSIHLGRSIAVPLQALSNWLINPAPPAPHTQRTDEIGLLARQLNQYFIADTQTDEATASQSNKLQSDVSDQNSNTTPARLKATVASDSQTSVNKPTLHPVQPKPVSSNSAPAAYTLRSAILAVELGNMEQLRQLPHKRLAQLLKKYRNAVEKSAALYNGHLHSLGDGRSLITFDSNQAQYPRNAVCCGELLRAFGHSLQMEVADCDIALQIQLGLSDGPSIKDASLGEVLLSESAQTALTLSQHSRNLLLLNDSLAHNPSIAACARTRSIAQPKNTNCLEALLGTYPALLEEQLHNLQKAN